MANAAALINEGLWRKDKEFQKLNRLAQCTFCQVLSMKDLDTAGVLTLHMDLLAKACTELTVEQLRADFAVLEASRFLFVDYDTDEIFVRSYMRTVSVKNQNSWRSVPKNCGMVASEKIRHEMAVELRRLRRSDASTLADEIDPVETASEPAPNPVPTGSERGTPSQPRRDGDSLGLVPVLESLPVVGSVGREPSPHCTDHPNGTDRNCFACGQARKTYPERIADWNAERASVAVVARNAAIAACRACDEFGDITFDDSVAKCTHREADHA